MVESTAAIIAARSRGADLVPQHVRVPSGLKNHLRGPEHRLRRQPYRVGPRQSVQHAGVRHGVDDEVQERGGAPCDARYGVHVLLLHLHSEADGPEDVGDGGLVRIGDGGVAAISHGALEDHAAVVGHDPDVLRIWHICPELLQRESGDYADQDLPAQVEAFGEHLGHLLGFHGEDDDVRFGADLLGSSEDPDSVGPGDSLAGGLVGSACDDAIPVENVLRYQAPDQGLRHLACAYESYARGHVRGIRMPVDKCSEIRVLRGYFYLYARCGSFMY